MAQWWSDYLDTLRSGAEVVEIAPGRVTLADGSVIAAGRIVCTLPLGVLQLGRVRFVAPLEPARQAAITKELSEIVGGAAAV